MLKAEVILDSLNVATGNRLTTFKLLFPHTMLAQLLTHRTMSRNTSSSRAVPVEKMVSKVTENIAYPVRWTKNQKGMQGYEEFNGYDSGELNRLHYDGLMAILPTVEAMKVAGVHKQHINRYLEPWMHVEMILSGTEFKNFFKLRMAADVFPDFQELSRLMFEAYSNSKPGELDPGEWHLPLVSDSELYDHYRGFNFTLDDLKFISSARCARVSYYLLGDGTLSNPETDKPLCINLAANGHFSPLEHPAQAMEYPEQYGNFVGFKQFRKFYAEESNGDYSELPLLHPSDYEAFKETVRM